MRISYSPTFADYWALNVHVLRKQFRAIIWIAGALTLLFLIFPLLLLVVPLTNQPNRGLLESYLGSLGLLILPGIVGFVFAATYWGAKKRWAAAIELREPREYVFDDAGIHVRSASTDAFCDWKIFKEAAVTTKSIYLNTAQRQFHYFPRSVVGDISQLQELLKSKIEKVTIV